MKPRPSDAAHWRALKNLGLTTWPGQRVVDLGCGSGYVAEMIARAGAAEVVGVDIVDPGLGDVSSWRFLAVDLNQEAWAQQVRGEAAAGRFDLVLAFDIIEHLDSPWRFLLQIRELLRPGGALVLTTPNTDSWECILRPTTWSGVRDPQHKVLFNRRSLAFILGRAGFAPQRLDAYMLRLEWLGRLSPPIGSQQLALATKPA